MLGVTKTETHHGNPGEKRILPAGLKVRLVPATNLPPDSEIKFWAHPILPERGATDMTPWPEDTRQWAEDVGVGLRADDVEVETLDDAIRRQGAETDIAERERQNDRMDDGQFHSESERRRHEFETGQMD